MRFWIVLYLFILFLACFSLHNSESSLSEISRRILPPSIRDQFRSLSQSFQRRIGDAWSSGRRRLLEQDPPRILRRPWSALRRMQSSVQESPDGNRRQRRTTTRSEGSSQRRRQRRLSPTRLPPVPQSPPVPQPPPVPWSPPLSQPPQRSRADWQPVGADIPLSEIPMQPTPQGNTSTVNSFINGPSGPTMITVEQKATLGSLNMVVLCVIDELSDESGLPVLIHSQAQIDPQTGEITRVMVWVRQSVLLQHSFVPYASTVPMIKIQEWLVEAHEDPSNPANFTPPFPHVPVDPNDVPWRSLDQGTVCCVCQERRSNTEVLPCRHMETCITCTRRIQATTSAYDVPFKCPICRSRVTRFSRVSDRSLIEGK